MSANKLWPNAEVVAVQIRLYSPGYVGPARWVLFEPRSRRAFAALGKDVVPDAISVMKAASGGVSREAILSQHSNVAPAHLDSLIGAGLLSNEPSPETSATTFLTTFHSANVDYPFFDYGSPASVQNESNLLDHYAKLWPAPSPILSRVGVRWPLPVAEVGSGSEPPAEREITLESLAWLLQTALVPVGRIRTRYVNCVRRTTPSGGARHPAEVALVLGQPIGDIPIGAYTYDIESGSLVAEPASITAAYMSALGDGQFCFLVRLRVDRAMWRYRDLRALRPVLIDAGHMVEMVAFLLARMGIITECVSAPVAWDGWDWLAEPEVAVIRPVAPIASGRRHTESDQQPTQRVRVNRSGEGFLTNPALVLRFGDQMNAAVRWPAARDVAIDLTDFLVLNHCLPSSRGDRSTDEEGIVTAIPGATPERIDQLREVGALLPYDDAAELYNGVRLWVRHEWYMALLAYIEALGDGAASPVASLVMPDCGYVTDLGALFKRRTSRAFSASRLTRGQLEALLNRALSHGGAPRPDVLLATWGVDGQGAGLFRWQSGSLAYVREAPPRGHVAVNSAGQPAASSGSATLWLSTLTDPSRPARYLMDLVDLGRLGQRICVAAVELGMATFLTPAVYDHGTCEMLGLGDPRVRLTYTFGLGTNPRSVGGGSVG